jgi:hypothetical protein
MRNTEECVSWVVYRMTIQGKKSGMSAVCEQGEWEALVLAQPGYHTLVRAGIANEGEAERLARSRCEGLDTKKSSARKQPRP